MGPTHSTRIELDTSPPPQVEAGASVALKIKVSCSEGCDLSGESIQVLDETGALVAEASLADENRVDELELRAPETLGVAVWSVVFPESGTDGVLHEGSSVSFRSEAIPHNTSVAVWGVPSPVVVSSPFTFRVGVRCSSSCGLAGQLVQVYDDTGRQVGEASLEGTPWRGTDALYSAEVAVTAPQGEAMCSWSVGFGETRAGLPHAESSATFTFRTAAPPEHTVAVRVVQESTNDPLEGADVRLGPYRARTDQSGSATLEVPKGRYEVNAWKAGFEAQAQTVEVADDLALRIEARPIPEGDLDPEPIWM